jgi:Ca2+-binding EF-hand superfamily protein
MFRTLGFALLTWSLFCPLSAQDAAAQQVLPAFPRGSERDFVDPADPIERFALLTAGGPLIVQVSLTIDGEPFRVGREKLLAEIVAAADTNKDGHTTWKEAMDTPRFTLGRLGNLNEQARLSLSRSFDRNHNDMVEVFEARHFMAQFSQGPTFLLGGAPTSLRVVAGVVQPAPDNKPDLLKLLDTDSSKSLDVGELAATMTRLKSRDADDNDVLEAAEVSGTPAVGMVRVAAAPGSTQPPTGTLLLGPTATEDSILGVSRKYHDDRGRLVSDCFPLCPELFAFLDKNQSGQIDIDELMALNNSPPHIDLTVDLANRKPGAGLKIVRLAPTIQKAADEKDNDVLELPGVRISLAASGQRPRVASYDSLVKSLLMQFDKDGNGYLDKTELPPLPGQFEMYDENGDGKAYPEEIAAGYVRQNAPQSTQVVASVIHQGNSLFQTLDTNRDGRLGLREMRAAAARLAALDKNQDQVIAGDEIPESFTVSFGLGGTGVRVDQPVIVSSPGARPASGRGPQWFIGMDRNGDGDVTLKEFLGTEADFQRLDANGDGLLDAQEAKAGSN